MRHPIKPETLGQSGISGYRYLQTRSAGIGFHRREAKLPWGQHLSSQMARGTKPETSLALVYPKPVATEHDRRSK
ncbi:hypothetical protein CYB_2390 [Synechococcus sp. JA-2-3B'a(2-13)]|nr:hypothetical protein CYB_2390 [Synechococcus sp. JA-2-3B'a(2-13)]